MPRPSPPEFRRRAAALVRTNKPITTAAVALGVSAASIHNWVRQDQIDRGERPGVTTPESIELARARNRIRQLEVGVGLLKPASKLLIVVTDDHTQRPQPANALDGRIGLEDPALPDPRARRPRAALHVAQDRIRSQRRARTDYGRGSSP